ncbi:hypothetical protein [Kribbella sp. NPDC048928]|uniref:hypothetical protein n=1 Tax=Kribbella sp. NPDC048928 TaxID=3364111 RepID=UPI003714D636
MSTQLQQEIDRWEAQLEEIAETSQSDSWFLEERRLTEAQQTIITYRGRILPLLAEPDDRFVATEIEHLVDSLEDLRNDLFRTVHPATSHEKIAETIAALRALVQVALRLEPAS